MRYFVLILAKIIVALPMAVALTCRLQEQNIGAAHSGMENLYLALLAFSSLLVALALVDAAWAIYLHRKSLSMTRQEVLDELKEDGGAKRARPHG